MSEKNKVPLQTKSDTDSFSSNTHPTLLFGEEAKGYVGDEEYKIPSAYGVDYLRLLPANVNTVFVYWEITDKLISGVTTHFDTFALKLLEVDGNEEREVLNFYFKDRASSRYINAYMPSKSLVAIIGVLDSEGHFYTILRSNVILMPSDVIVESNEEAWMSKKSDWMELIKASVSHLSHAKSSLSLIKDLEFLKKYSEKSVLGMSSSELVKKD